MRNTLLSFFVFILVFTSFAPTAVAEVDKHTHRKYGGVMSDYYYDQLAICETGGNWNHSTLSYTGGLGIARGTWQRWSNSSSAKGKTARYQVQVADNIAFRGHWEEGEFINPVGPWGWGCVSNRSLLRSLICKSRNPVVKKYQRRCWVQSSSSSSSSIP